MSDETQAIPADVMPPETVPIDVAAPPKRKRGRPSAAQKEAEKTAEQAYIEAVGGEPEQIAPARNRKRRAVKLTGSDFAALVNMSSSMAAMVIQQPHWVITEKELQPWANEAADLLNRLPTKYMTAAANFSGFGIVAVGIYTTLQPRIDASQKIAAQSREQRAARAAARNGVPHESVGDANRESVKLNPETAW